MRVIGKRLKRPDSRPKLTGHETYTADIRYAGTLHGGLVLSTQARARIRGIDTSAACAEPGVVAVVTAANLPEWTRADEVADRACFFLAHQRVAYVGQPIAVVLAEDAATAERAADLVTVDYDPLPVVAHPLAALEPDAPTVRDGVPNVNGTVEYHRGDVEAAFASAAVVVEREFRAAGVHQGYLEPRAVIAVGDPTGRLTIFTPTQGQFMIRSAVARALRLNEADVVIRPSTVGGGFGAKYTLLEPLAGWLALHFGRPISLVLTRRQDFAGTTPAPEALLRVGIAADGEGTFTGLRADLTYDTGYFSHSPYLLAGLMAGSTYRVANLAIVSREVSTNRAGAGAYRAPGLPQLAFALETLVDEVAQALGISAVELRRRNVAVGGDPMADGAIWPPFDARLLLDAVESHPLWSAPLGPDEGCGVALGMMRGATESASASARLNPDGTLSVIVGSIDLTGTTGGLTQIAAEVFGVSPERISVLTAPTDSAPHSGVTGGSKIIYTVGNAVVQAAGDARQQVLAIAAEALEVGSDDLDIDDEHVFVRGAPDRMLTLREVYARSVAIGSRHAPVFGHGNVANPQKGPTSAAHLARVKVDRETGVVRVTGYVAVQDVGRAINPAEIDGQIHGAVAQGIGWGLNEGMLYDDDGQLLTATFMDYPLLHGQDVPQIETLIVENPAPRGPFGARGVGEVPIIPPAAALANAIYAATGVRLQAMPMTAERVWRAIAQRDQHPALPPDGGDRG